MLRMESSRTRRAAIARHAVGHSARPVGRRGVPRWITREHDGKRVPYRADKAAPRHEADPGQAVFRQRAVRDGGPVGATERASGAVKSGGVSAPDGVR